MKSKFLIPVIVAVIMLFTPSLTAKSLYIFFDESCMDRLEYKFQDDDGGDFIVYNINLSNSEKIILDVGQESKRYRSSIPSVYVNCSSGGFDRQLVKAINDNIDETFLVYRKGNRKYSISPIRMASYYVKTDQGILYDGPNYKFNLDLRRGTIGENISYKNPAAQVFFEGKLDMACTDGLLFRQLAPSSEFPHTDLVFIPEVGVVEERSGLNLEDALKNTMRLEKVNGKSLDRHLRKICGENDIVATRDEEELRQKTPETSERLPTNMDAKSVEAKVHTVAKGENLYRISLKYGVSVSDIQDWNGLGKSNMIKRGQKLIVSDPVVVEVEQPREEEIAAVDVNPSFPVPYDQNEVTSKGGTYHFVKRGETVASIAMQYGYTENRFREMNNLGKRDYVKIGQRLKVSECNCPDNNNSTSSITPVTPEEFDARMPVTRDRESGEPNPSYYSNQYNNESREVRPQEREFEINNDAEFFDATVPQSYDSPRSANTNIPLQNVGVNRKPQSYYDFNSGRNVTPQSYDAYSTKGQEKDFRNTPIFYDTPISTSNYDAYNPRTNYQPEYNPTIDDLTTKGIDFDSTPTSYDSTPSPTVKRTTHVVQEGETLYSIARKFGTTVKKLREINSLELNEIIIPYQRLYID